MIDLHTHLLPGVDDGSPTLENSVRVLERLRADGVTDVACTPHLDASRAAAAPCAQHRALLDQLRKADQTGMRLHSGFEIMLDQPGCDLTLPGLSLGGSKAVLVELPRVPLSSHATDELLRLRASGIIPVIAHPERYAGITIDRLHIWRDIGVVVQGDALMLLSAGTKSEFSRRMLAEGVVDILASDNHGDTRSLATVRLWLREVGGDTHARILMEKNPRHLLDDHMLEGAPRLRDRKSIWDRLRELFTVGRGA
ncbi:MAG: CpsB/CapC family capsule biosynthesis tyrosine phosphatase [Gemmatimonadaceae bacterium]